MIVREATPNDAAGIASVHVDVWRTTYRGIVPDDYLASLSYEARERFWRRALAAWATSNLGYIYVAEADSQIVGFADGGCERTGDSEVTGEFAAVYVRDERQGRGVGRELARAIAARLWADGHRSMLIWVLAANTGARRFYEALGGRPDRRRSVEIAGVNFDEVGYVWPDLSALLRPTRRSPESRDSAVRNAIEPWTNCWEGAPVRRGNEFPRSFPRKPVETG